MTRLERVRAAVRREPVDRVPYAVWCHFPAVDRSPARLAQAVLRFQQRYGSDLLVITPAAGLAVEDWGCVESDTVLPDGSRPCARHAVERAGDWARIRPLDIESSGYGRQLETLVRLLLDPRADAPPLPAVTSPLTLVRTLAGDRLPQDLRERPEAVIAALEAITDTLGRFVDLCLQEGAAGIFYTVHARSRGVHGEEEYARFGEPYDRRILEAATRRAGVVVVHAQGEAPMLDRLARLPAHVWSWDARVAAPSLGAGKAAVSGAVLGGVSQWGTLRTGTPDDVRAEVRAAVDEVDGIGLVVGPGGLLPLDVPDTNVVALVKAAGGQTRLVL